MRYPHWNDSALINVAQEAGISWKAFAAGVPVGERNDLLVPALVVNPSIEVAQLVQSGDRWTATAAFGPRSANAEVLGLQPLWSGLPPRSSDGRAWAFTSPGEVAVATFGKLWSAPATEEFTALVQQYGGMLLIVASTVGPDSPAAVEVLTDALEAWDSMTRWVSLKSDASGQDCRTTLRRQVVREVRKDGGLGVQAQDGRGRFCLFQDALQGAGRPPAGPRRPCPSPGCGSTHADAPRPLGPP